MNSFIKSMIDELRYNFALGNMVTRLILLNVAVWVGVNVIGIFLNIPFLERLVTFDQFLRWFSVSAYGVENLWHPWGIVTHAFLHRDIGHLFWNMITLAWAGRVVGDLLGDKRVLTIYLMSAFAGAICYFFHAQFSNVIDGYAYGASAAAMGLVLAAAMVAPEYEINLLFLGPVKLKYLAALIVFLDVIAVSNSIRFGGGSIAHLGGALMGYFYVAQLNNGIEIGKPLTRLIDYLSNLWKNKGRGTMKNRTQNRTKGFQSHKNPNYTGGGASGQKETPKTAPSDPIQLKLDSILDKIKQDGYESLTAEEKDFLFNASKK
ncbi:MAG: hypothetical protein RL757_1308 [Bacteroidota bacterium]|jgi:membrane associated rhomboid family serine protease